MPYLIISLDSQDYKVIQLATVTRLGRGDHNDIVLNDPEDTSISRFHAYIEKVDESYLLVDRSTNGTQVNNENIKEYTLFHGAVFNIFDYRFTFIDDLAAVSIDQPITFDPGDLAIDVNGNGAYDYAIDFSISGNDVTYSLIDMTVSDSKWGDVFYSSHYTEGNPLEAIIGNVISTFHPNENEAIRICPRGKNRHLTCPPPESKRPPSICDVAAVVKVEIGRCQ